MKTVFIFFLSVISLETQTHASNQPAEVKMEAELPSQPGTTSTVDVPAASTSTSGDLDAEVTDIKMRASSGAKSRYSSSLNFYYSGGSLRRPDSDIRPNVGNKSIASPVSLTGDVGLRFRMNKNESVYVATGFHRMRPFHSREKDERLEINSPYLGYNNTWGMDEWQLSSALRVYIVTVDYARDFGQVMSVGPSISFLRSIGYSRFNLGMSASVYWTYYDKHDEALQPRQEDYGASIAPSLQYNKAGPWNLYTSLSLINYSHRRSDSEFKFIRRTVTQSLGLGFAVFRDLYVSPSITFEPTDISADKTAVSLSATINL